MHTLARLIVSGNQVKIDCGYEVLIQITMICTSRCILSFDNMMHVAMEGMMLLTLTTCCFEVCLNEVPKLFNDVLIILSAHIDSHPEMAALTAME